MFSVATASANAGRVIASWKISDMSYAEDIIPGPSSPLTVAAYVLVAPISAAWAFIASTVASRPPIWCASTVAASLPDAIRSPLSSCSTEYSPPGPTPTRLPSAPSRSDSSTSMTRSGSRVSSTTEARSVLITLAGRYRPCASRAATTSPVSRSEISHALAVTSCGTSKPSGTASSHPSSAEPPAAASGAGGGGGTVMPGNGTSDSSTGAGGVARNGQPATSRGAARYSDVAHDGSSAGAGNGTSDSSTGAGGVVRNGQPATSRGVSKYSDEVDDGSSAGAGGSVGIVSTRGSAIPGTAPTPGSIAVAGPASASGATAIAEAVTRPARRCGERDCRVLLTGHESTSGVRGPGPWPAGRYSLPVPKLAARQPSPAAVARHRRPPAVAPGAAARQPSPLAPPPVALAE